MPLIQVEKINKRYKRPRGPIVHAVNGVSFSIAQGETLALIGESGSGKSTVGRLALGLILPDGGVVEFDGQPLGACSHKELRALRARMQIVFQEPAESLNPRMTVGDTVSEPLVIHERTLSHRERVERAVRALDEVGLNAAFMARHPSDLSGGEQQRVGIARAIITRPDFVVLDEPTSSLDLSIRAQILILLKQLQESLDLTYLFISHDIATVESIADRVAVMYLGQIVETGPTAEVLAAPKHPYTKALLSATLSTDPDDRPEHLPLRGEIPSPTHLPSGCFLYGRCPIQAADCALAPVPLMRVADNHLVACIKVVPRSELALIGSKAPHASGTDSGPNG